LPHTEAHSADEARRLEARRLIALAHDMLKPEREQIVRDFLHHALGALERCQREEDRLLPPN